MGIKLKLVCLHEDTRVLQGQKWVNFPTNQIQNAETGEPVESVEWTRLEMDETGTHLLIRVKNPCVEARERRPGEKLAGEEP